MDVFDAVRTVLAVRRFQDKPVPQDVVLRILESARLSASASNKQPWHFIVVQDREMLRQLGAAARTGPYIAQAPLAVVVVIEESKHSESDASRAIQNMIMTAWDAGVGSNWVGFYGLDEVKPLLGIPEGLKVLAILPFGYPVNAAALGHKNRKALSAVVSRERFGQPLE